jgi:ribosomal protein S18 acetylase RimI-like enzyme
MEEKIMENFNLAKIIIRGIKESDVSAIVEIEEKNLCIKRNGYWKRELRKNKEGRFLGSCVAELEGTVIGFILGDIGSREFGMPENMGWIHTIGIHPDYQHKGVARALFDDYRKRFLKLDVDTIYTIVSLSDNMQLPFFEKIGFRPGNRIYLEFDTKDELPKADRLSDYDFRRIM